MLSRKLLKNPHCGPHCVGDLYAEALLEYASQIRSHCFHLSFLIRYGFPAWGIYMRMHCWNVLQAVVPTENSEHS